MALFVYTFRITPAEYYKLTLMEREALIDVALQKR